MDLRINGTEFEHFLDDGEFPEKLMELVENALARMKDSPGDLNETINLVIVNDFESEDEEEDEESDDEATETEGKEVK